jgi:hypothetical protein
MHQVCPLHGRAALAALVKSASNDASRESENVRPGGRSARVVSAVLQSRLDVLGRSGYGRLRVGDVAAAAGVNKTIIYRQCAAKRLRSSRPKRRARGQPHGGTDVVMRSTRRIGSLFVN